MKGLVEHGTGINCKVCVYGSTCNTGRGHAYHVKSCVQYTEGKPKTNADRIRSMSDEELAVFLSETTSNAIVVLGIGSNGKSKNAFDWYEWLKEEVSE